MEPTPPPAPPADPGPSGPSGPDRPGTPAPDWSTPPSPPSRSHSGVTVAAIVATFVLLAAAAVLLAVDATTQQSTDSFTGVDEIRLDLDNADVEVTAGADETTVGSTVRTGVLGGRASTEVRDGTLHVVYDCPWINGLVFGLGCSGDYHLTVPDGVEVTGGTGNGDVRVTGLGGDLDLQTSNGDFHLVDTSGRVTVRTSNGEIIGTDLASTDLVASTSNGQIVVAFTVSPQTVRATSSNGTVETVVPEDGTSYAVDTSTSNGQDTTDLPTDPSSDRRIELSTSNGDVVARSR